MFQLKEDPPHPNETGINNLPDKEFKAIVIRMLTELGKRIGGHNVKFNKNIQKKSVTAKE